LRSDAADTLGAVSSEAMAERFTRRYRNRILALAADRAESHIQGMVAPAKKKARSGRSKQAERAVIYRGIRIEPAVGKRSPLARAIRDGFREMAEQARDEPTPA